MPIAGQQRALDDLVVPVDRKLLFFLVDHGVEEGHKVLGVERRRRRRQPPRHVEMADDLGRAHATTSPGFDPFHIAAALDRQIDDHRAGPHRGHHVLTDQPRRRAPRDQGRGDDDVLLLDVLGGECGLLGLILRRHRLGIAARRLRVLELLVLDGEELRPQALHLFLGRRPHVGRRHNGAETPGRGDRLQAGNAHPHDEHLRRRHRAGRRHHHRQRAAVLLRRIDHRAVTRQVRLAREHVHRLRPRDARHQLHGKGQQSRHPPSASRRRRCRTDP